MSIPEAKVHERGKHGIGLECFERLIRTSSVCKYRYNMSLFDRTFVCKSCGLPINRDNNAAHNIKSWGINSGLEDIRRTKTATLA